MTDRDRTELQVAALIGAVLGGVTGYVLSYLVESGGLAQNTYLGAHWRSRRQRAGFLSSGFSFVNACTRRFPPLGQSRTTARRLLVKEGLIGGHPAPRTAGVHSACRNLQGHVREVGECFLVIECYVSK